MDINSINEVTKLGIRGGKSGLVSAAKGFHTGLTVGSDLLTAPFKGLSRASRAAVYYPARGMQRLYHKFNMRPPIGVDWVVDNWKPNQRDALHDFTDWMYKQNVSYRDLIPDDLYGQILSPHSNLGRYGREVGYLGGTLAGAIPAVTALTNNYVYAFKGIPLVTKFTDKAIRGSVKAFGGSLQLGNALAKGTEAFHGLGYLYPILPDTVYGIASPYKKDSKANRISKNILRGVGLASMYARPDRMLTYPLLDSIYGKLLGESVGRVGTYTVGPATAAYTLLQATDIKPDAKPGSIQYLLSEASPMYHDIAQGNRIRDIRNKRNRGGYNKDIFSYLIKTEDNIKKGKYNPGVYSAKMDMIGRNNPPNFIHRILHTQPYLAQNYMIDNFRRGVASGIKNLANRPFTGARIIESIRDSKVPLNITFIKD